MHPIRDCNGCGGGLRCLCHGDGLGRSVTLSAVSRASCAPDFTITPVLFARVSIINSERNHQCAIKHIKTVATALCVPGRRLFDGCARYAALESRRVHGNNDDSHLMGDGDTTARNFCTVSDTDCARHRANVDDFMCVDFHCDERHIIRW